MTCIPGGATQHSGVLVRTLPLSNNNYGGVLQAYALQTCLGHLGANSAVDVSERRSGPSLEDVKTSIKRAGVALRAPGFRQRWGPGLLRPQVSSTIEQFVSRRIRTVSLFEKRQLSLGLLEQFGVLLAGSDQVWRRRYGDVLSYLFDFADASRHRMISYAASFGLDDLSEYSRDERRRAGNLLERFSAISVRERSAVDLCEREWGITAEQHIDPTMLLPMGHYRTLAQRGQSPRSAVSAYILDQSTSTAAAIETLAHELDRSVSHLIPVLPPSRSHLARDPLKYRWPTVETWLRAFDESEFVVTDSFHGTVFAIMSRTPFVALVNHMRGRARFETLLELTGLGARLVSRCEPDQLGSALTRSIDWEDVERRLEGERNRSLSFLQRHALLEVSS